jgi:hypothetical protein
MPAHIYQALFHLALSLTMVAFNHLLAGVLAFGSVSTVLGMPTGNATLKARAPRKLCGSSKRPGANEALLAQGPGANTAELIDINVYWSVTPMCIFGFRGVLTSSNYSRHVVYADESRNIIAKSAEFNELTHW